MTVQFHRRWLAARSCYWFSGQDPRADAVTRTHLSRAPTSHEFRRTTQLSLSLPLPLPSFFCSCSCWSLSLFSSCSRCCFLFSNSSSSRRSCNWSSTPLLLRPEEVLKRAHILVSSSEAAAAWVGSTGGRNATDLRRAYCRSGFDRPTMAVQHNQGCHKTT